MTVSYQPQHGSAVRSDSALPGQAGPLNGHGAGSGRLAMAMAPFVSPKGLAAGALCIGMAWLLPAVLDPAAAVTEMAAMTVDAAGVPTPRPRPYGGTPRARPFKVVLSLPEPRPTTVQPATPRARPLELGAVTPRPAPRGHVDLPEARPLPVPAVTTDSTLPRGSSLAPDRSRPVDSQGPAMSAPQSRTAGPGPDLSGHERPATTRSSTATFAAGSSLNAAGETGWDTEASHPVTLTAEDLTVDDLAGIAPSAGTPHPVTPPASAIPVDPPSGDDHAGASAQANLTALIEKTQPAESFAADGPAPDGTIMERPVEIAMAANPLPLPARLTAPRPEALQETSWSNPLAGAAQRVVPAPRPRPDTIFPTALTRAPVAGAPSADNLNVLTEQDAALYARAFDLQADGKWAAADKVIRQIDDPLLMGHLREQRLMHPGDYRASFEELQAWMHSYADHPDADRVHRLAQQRRPAGARLQAPRAADLSVLDTALRNRTDRSSSDAAPSDKSNAPRRGSLGAVKRAYYSGKYKQALDVAEDLVRRHGAKQPGGSWYAGLSAWRLQRYDVAARHFAALAAFDTADPWEKSAGGYWAARAYLTLGKPAAAIRSLQEASEHSRTFYGLLAARRLGLDPVFGWTKLSDDETLVGALFAVAGVKRALGLAQTGQRDRARAELRQLMDARRKARDGVFLPMLTALLGLTGDAQTAYRMARLWHARTGEYIDTAMYPEPPWQPQGGFTFDRALIYAFVRKESRFDPVAKSPAGARGLMQLMPATARFVNGSGRNLSRILNDPASNLELGQRYIRHLERDVGLGSDLIRIAIAYNAGPGNLEKWERLAGHGGDPLLLIESLPSAETRDFVERILANLWVYRARLGQPSPSLDDLAGGAWPRYVPLDAGPTESEAGNGNGRKPG